MENVDDEIEIGDGTSVWQPKPVKSYSSTPTYCVVVLVLASSGIYTDIPKSIWQTSHYGGFCVCFLFFCSLLRPTASFASGRWWCWRSSTPSRDKHVGTEVNTTKRMGKIIFGTQVLGACSAWWLNGGECEGVPTRCHMNFACIGWCTIMRGWRSMVTGNELEKYSIPPLPVPVHSQTKNVTHQVFSTEKAYGKHISERKLLFAFFSH